MDDDIKAVLDGLARRHVLPRATYRLQFSHEFTFAQAAVLADYLAELGVSHAYCSPLLKAGADSTHGYDIVDHNHLNPNLGGDEGFLGFSDALRAHGLGLVLDIVPNHMGIADPGNTWWQDVLENGPSSLYAGHFDIQWHPAADGTGSRIVLPILEDQYGKVLEEGKLKLVHEEGAFFVHYYDFRMPVAPGTYSPLLTHRLDELKRLLGENSEPLTELLSIMTAISHLPPRTALPPEQVAERNREKEIIKRRIAALEAACPEVREALERTVEDTNGRIGEPASFDPLDRLIGNQAWRPAFWRVASEEINFRRFFEINTLAAIRVERIEVFEATHRLILRLLAEGRVNALRIDHPDGLWDPAQYLRRLQVHHLLALWRAAQGHEPEPDSPARPVSDWLDAFEARRAGRDEPWPLWVVVEKILSEGEPLPPDWMCAGTTGYDFIAAAEGLFIDADNQRAFDKIYAQFSGQGRPLREIVHASKLAVMRVSLASEIIALSLRLYAIAKGNRRTRDFTLGGLRAALREVVAALAVYRTYITARTHELSARDREYIESAIRVARRRTPEGFGLALDFIRETLLLRNLDQFPPAMRPEIKDFIMKFQQVAGPVMAKGFEDTALYVQNRLVSLNEVGVHPDRFGIDPDGFHAHNAERRAQWPHAMLAGSTHDTKRSEDVRARIHVLSELPGEWRAALGRWSRRNAGRKTFVDGEPAPDRNDEYLLYQTLIGAWPEAAPGSPGFADFRERIGRYMEKATREAKVHTSWINANEGYDAAVQSFVARLLDDSRRNPFLEELGALARRVAFFGRFNSLSQLLLRLTAPGVPDIYQGSELWDLSLVDPDNRRPVDYPRRRAELARLREHTGDPATLAEELMGRIEDGAIKLHVLQRALALRRKRERLFSHGDYLPLAASGGRARHVTAFARREGEAALIAVVPRLVVGLTRGEERPPIGGELWADTRLTLPEGWAGRPWRNIFTGEMVEPEPVEAPALALGRVLARFPLALLEAPD